jgi:hypothetical protein
MSQQHVQQSPATGACDSRLVRVEIDTVGWFGYVHDESDTQYLVWSTHSHKEHWVDKANVDIGHSLAH